MAKPPSRPQHTALQQDFTVLMKSISYAIGVILVIILVILVVFGDLHCLPKMA